MHNFVRLLSVQLRSCVRWNESIFSEESFCCKNYVIRFTRALVFAIIFIFCLVAPVLVQQCDSGGALSTCNITCLANAEQVTGPCKATKRKCCRFMCAGPGSFCLQEGSEPKNLGFKEVRVFVPGDEELLCPEKGICVKEPSAPENWPYQFPWPPVSLWPPSYAFPEDYDFPRYWPCSWAAPPSWSYRRGMTPIEISPGPCPQIGPNAANDTLEQRSHKSTGYAQFPLVREPVFIKHIPEHHSLRSEDSSIREHSKEYISDKTPKKFDRHRYRDS